jgi:2-keto-4-pentenoate hydratase/2-oxohepta-3-ene-1,7-dioic acid hydratase in catechol pathway
MKVARVVHDGAVHHGIVEGADVHLLDRAPYLGGRETGRTLPLTDVVLDVPVEPSKVLCVGRNYADHIAEMGYELPSRPSLFMKPPTALLAPGWDVKLPPPELSDDVEHEAELVVVIGRTCRGVTPEDALDHVFGFTCANDVSARDLQRSDSDVVRAKGFDTFCPIGPWVTTDVDLAAGVRVRARVNGDLRQDGHTSQLVFDVPFLVSYLSAFATLLPGDVILTGSPGGTGRLRVGDEVEIEVPEIGVLRHGVAR